MIVAYNMAATKLLTKSDFCYRNIKYLGTMDRMSGSLLLSLYLRVKLNLIKYYFQNDAKTSIMFITNRFSLK